MPLVMGVDSALEVTTVEVRDADDGSLVASGEARHTSEPFGPEADPGGWWASLVAAVRATGVRDVVALAVAAEPRGVVVLDGAGAVLHAAAPLDDPAAAELAARMIERVGAEKWARACGSLPDGRSAIAHLGLLAAGNRSLYGRLATVLLPADLLTYRLTGRLVTDRGGASATGYWSPNDGRWRTDVLERTVGHPPTAAWSDHLPDVIGPTDPSDYVNASQNQKVGLRGRPLCGAGTGRPMATALAVGLQPGDVLVTLDDTGTVSVGADRPVADRSGFVHGWADATGAFLPSVDRCGAVAATSAVARILGVDAAGLDALALRAAPGAGGVVLDAGGAGVLYGLGGEVTREQVARAAVEGVVCGVLDALDAISATGIDTSGRLVAVGPGAASAACRRVLADLSGRELVVPHLAAPSATGACVQAAAVLHGSSPHEVAEAWGLDEGAVVAPSSSVDRLAVRRAHRAAIS